MKSQRPGYGYRQNGQVSTQTNVIAGMSYATSWTYTNMDLPATMTYPGGNVLTYSYDTEGHVSGITDRPS